MGADGRLCPAQQHAGPEAGEAADALASGRILTCDGDERAYQEQARGQSERNGMVSVRGPDGEVDQECRAQECREGQGSVASASEVLGARRDLAGVVERPATVSRPSSWVTRCTASATVPSPSTSPRSTRPYHAVAPPKPPAAPAENSSQGLSEGLPAQPCHLAGGQREPSAATASTGGGATVSSVSCPPAGACAAGGSYRDRHQNFQGFVVSQTG
jgi:hypothetical protein